jgi:hypothetical protein
VSGSFTAGGKIFSARVSLSVKTNNGYFCTATNGTIAGTKVT